MKKTICLNMIVKNESAVIQRCLESVKTLIDYWVVVDTGSTDGTQKIIHECLRKFPGKLHERPWVNFAHNRNEVLQLAKNTSDYLLLIDADDYLVFSPSFAMPILDLDCYVVDFVHGRCRSQRVLLCRNDYNWKWEGVVHETIDFSHATGEMIDGVCYMTTIGGNRSKDLRKKYLADARILENALIEEPENTRYVFHLATSYEDAFEYALALKNFKKRAQMGGDVQEIFYSLYRIGVLEENLSLPKEIFLKSYLKAFQYCPIRIEPLFCMANFYIKNKNYLLGYLLSKHALSIPFSYAHCYTQMDIYDYGLLNQFSECSFRIGKYRESYEALQQLLTVPNLPSGMREAGERNLALPIFNEFRSTQ